MIRNDDGHEVVFIYDEDGLFEIKSDLIPFELTGGIQGSISHARESVAGSGWACSNEKNCK